MEKLEAVAVDVTQSVFENETNEILYVVRDVHAAETRFVFCLLGHSFSVYVSEANYERDLQECMKWESLFQPDRKEKMKKEMRRIIEGWHD